MIENDLNTFQTNHNELKRCNSILEENWKDSSADQFRTTYLGPIDTACTAFIGESFVHAQELRRCLEELEELGTNYRKLINELSEICSNPSWKDCGIGIVEGHDELNRQLHCQEFFVVPKDKMPYLNNKEVMARLAMLQVTTLDEHENPRFYTSI